MPPPSPPERTLRWRAGPTKALTVHGVVLRFGFTRTVVTKVEAWLGDDPENQLPFQFATRLNRAAAWVPEAIDLGGGQPLTVEVTYKGEGLDLVSVTWLVASDSVDQSPVHLVPTWLDGYDRPNAKLLNDVLRVRSDVQEWPTSGSEGLEPVHAMTPERVLEMHRFTDGDLPAVTADQVVEGLSWGAEFHADGSPEELGAQKEARALYDQRRAAVDLRGRIERFFLEFDRLSDGRFTSGVTVRSLQSILGSRNTERREGGRCGRRVSSQVMDHAGLISCRVAAGWFDTALTRSRLAEEHIGFALEMFVSGRLSVVHPDQVRRGELKNGGTTNSGMYFLFPELALACARHPVTEHFSISDRLKWCRRAGHLIRAAHVLITYRWANLSVLPGAGPDPDITAYQYFDGLSMSMARIEAFREAYEDAAVGWGQNGTEDVDRDCDVWEDVYGQVLAVVEPPCESEEVGSFAHVLPQVSVPPLVVLGGIEPPDET